MCDSLRNGTLCIDMSTIAPEVTVSVATEVRKRGGAYLDAPVSGGKTGAEAGTLSIMVGGDEVDVARAKPIFDVLGRSTVHCGPVGNGQRSWERRHEGGMRKVYPRRIRGLIACPIRGV